LKPVAAIALRAGNPLRLPAFSGVQFDTKRSAPGLGRSLPTAQGALDVIGCPTGSLASSESPNARALGRHGLVASLLAQPATATRRTG